MVPKNEVWSKKVSETKAHRAGRYRKEMAGVPESDECRKRDLECWKGPASVAWSKGWLARIGRPEYLPEDIAGQIRGYKKQTAP